MYGFAKFSESQFKTFGDIVDYCSAHNIEYSGFAHFKSYFLPPNLTSHLQPVDAAVSSSLKCHSRRLLVRHILDSTEEPLSKEPSARDSLNNLRCNCL